jgi:hypothetical protein
VQVDQEKLNAVRIDEWDDENHYEKLFQVKLTAKHALQVGKWQYRGFKGVDLRRYSYNEERLLGTGITIDQETWQKLSEIILQLNKQKHFVKFGGKDPAIYKKSIPIDKVFHIETGAWSGDRDKIFFTINICKASGQLIWKAQGTFLGMMIRFDTVSNFLSQCKDYGLIDSDTDIMSTDRQVNTKTGRIIV